MSTLGIELSLHRHPQQHQMQDQNQVRQGLISGSQNPNPNHAHISLPIILAQTSDIIDPVPYPPQQPSTLSIQPHIHTSPSSTTPLPTIPIFTYKYYLQICLFFGSLIQIAFFSYCFIHIIWLTWYITLGYWRFNPHLTRLRFFSQLFNIAIWLLSNCYLFASQPGQHKSTIFPLLILLVNLDFYFIGSRLVITYLCWTTYVLWQWVADVRLYFIGRRLRERRETVVEGFLGRFVEKNEQIKQREGEKGDGMLGEKVIEEARESLETECSVEGIVKTETKDFHQKQRESSSTCSICLLHLTHQNIHNNPTLRLFCQHRFHYACLKTWILSGHESCPVCKRSMVQLTESQLSQ